MLGSAAVSVVQRYLGFRTDLLLPVQDEFAKAQDKFEGGIPTNGGGTFMPWFLIKDSAGLATVANSRSVALPDDWLLENEEDELFLYDPTNTEEPYCTLIKDDPDSLQRSLSGTGRPQAYALVGTGYRLYPLPDDIYQLQTSYYGADADFDMAAENKWLKYVPNLLIGEVGMAMTIPTRESRQEVFTYFQNIRAEAISMLHIRTEERLHTNRRYVMGGDN
jgi:hypothetical protein